MSDIKQAAEWARDGRTVKRECRSFTMRLDLEDGCVLANAMTRAFGILNIECEDGGIHELCTDDLLADDWEVAQGEASLGTPGRDKP